MIIEFTVSTDLIPRLCHLANAEGDVPCEAELSVDTYPTGHPTHYVEDAWPAAAPGYPLSDSERDLLKAEAWDAAASQDDAQRQMAEEAAAERRAEDRYWHSIKR